MNKIGTSGNPGKQVFRAAVALQSRSGIFRVIKIERTFQTKEFKALLRRYQESKTLNRLVNKGCLEYLPEPGFDMENLRTGESYQDFRDQIDMTMKLRAQEVRYLYIRRFGFAGFDVYSLNDTGFIYSMKSKRQLRMENKIAI